MKTCSRLLFCLLFVFQNKMAAAPFLVISPSPVAEVTAEKAVARPLFFSKKKLKKLVSRLGPPEWEAEPIRAAGLRLAIIGLAIFAFGIGLSIAAALETPAIFVVCAVVGSVLCILALGQSQKERGPVRLIVQIFSWITISLTALFSILAIISTL